MNVEKKNIRKNYPTVTGNFIIAGDPRFNHFDKKGSNNEFYIVNFSLYWKPFLKGKDFDKIDASYMKAFLIVNPDKIDAVRESIKRKARIHIAESVPMLDKWISKKDGNEQERSEIKIRVYEYYPYFLDKDLNPIEEKESDKTKNKKTKTKTVKTEDDNDDNTYSEVSEEDDTDETNVEKSDDDQDINDYV